MAFPHSWGFPEVAQFSAFLGLFLKFVEKAYRMVFASMRAVIKFVLRAALRKISARRKEGTFWAK